MTNRLNRYSSRITQPKSQGASQAMLHGTGLTREDLDKAQVGISSVWYEGNTCNMHLNDLAARVREGVQAAGLVGMRFNTIGVSDGISMGTDGMSYSLQSRDLIADSIETVMCAQWYDANISIPGCDKNMPACVMAMARLNRPSVFVYGGTIRPGAQRRDIVSVFEAVGALSGGKIDDAELLEVEQTAIPGPGACGGMYTANTMASAIEALGMSLANSSAQEAVSEQKKEDCRRAGAAVMNLIENAAKYSSPRAPITLSAERRANEVVFSVADEGLGIPAKHLEHLFERFYRVNGEGRHGPGGTGLGLAICKRIVEAHDGRIWVVSTPGSGSHFRFSLPVEGTNGSADAPGSS